MPDEKGLAPLQILPHHYYPFETILGDRLERPLPEVICRTKEAYI